ncbi:hypothetical protein AUR64_03785 [Haloprofundus marisrubri]|uniref:Uncharacterized protein n=1 Tax=Haloprofundus marisrubri TaxID=1514971 RepID=A0A0W1RCT5_9EURY|nr:hypothetical protein [Haloprofundus marisrubri]KTG11386.1 hypothetical protein AUR64_03785 [Haloprofundus marisrubri]
MIPTLELPEYYLESVDMDVSPTVGETVVGVLGSNLQVESPTLKDEPEGLQCEAALSLQLFYNGKAPWQVDEEVEERFGTVDTEFVIYVPGEESQFEPYIEEWLSTEEYKAADREFRHHLESGILQYILDPIGELLENSYNGIVPRIAFTSGPSERDA